MQMGPHFLSNLEHLHTVQIFAVPETSKPDVPDFLFDDTYSNVEEELRIWAQAQGLVAEGEDGGIEVLEFVKWSLGESTESA